MGVIEQIELYKPFVLGIAEKPSAANRIALALGGKNARKVMVNNVPVHVIRSEDEGQDLVIASATGHVFTLIQDGYGSEYPTYDFIWVPLHQKSRSKGKQTSRSGSKTKAIIGVLKELIQHATSLVIMTDYDQEGEVIGAVILQELGGKHAIKKAKRMKFSTLTKTEIKKAYSTMIPHIDFRLFESGLARHYLDWLFGVNLSRALMLAYKRSSGKYQTLSTGRVQGPTLRFVYEREIQIRTQVPFLSWQVVATLDTKPTPISLTIKKSIERISEARQLNERLKHEHACVTKKTTTMKKIPPPPPFNLSTLQAEAYRRFRIPPDRTLAIAERLYLDALISYPRTDSQQYPKDLDHNTIISKLIERRPYKEYSTLVLPISKGRPIVGSKRDPAHPAIFPTGEKNSRKLSPQEYKILDLIIRRYLATLAPDALEEQTQVVLDIASEQVKLSHNKIVELGWKAIASVFRSDQNNEILDLNEGDKIHILSSNIEEKMTKVPPRYNPGSLLKKMEQVGLGTKATRAQIIKTLEQRGYLLGKEEYILSDLGFTVMEVLKMSVPVVTLPSLTRTFENAMERITQASLSYEKVILQGIVYLHQVLKKLHGGREIIGEQLSQVLSRPREVQKFGSCPVCKQGNLVIRQAKASRKRFLGCSNYFDTENPCTASFPLPQKGTLYPSTKRCDGDGYPLIRVRRGRRTYYWCVNPDCPERKSWAPNSKIRNNSTSGEAT